MKLLIQKPVFLQQFPESKCTNSCILSTQNVRKCICYKLHMRTSNQFVARVQHQPYCIANVTQSIGIRAALSIEVTELLTIYSRLVQWQSLYRTCKQQTCLHATSLINSLIHSLIHSLSIYFHFILRFIIVTKLIQRILVLYCIVSLSCYCKGKVWYIFGPTMSTQLLLSFIVQFSR